MVDTSGRSHRNELKISEIKSFADMVEYDFEKILCVSANTKKARPVRGIQGVQQNQFQQCHNHQGG